MIQAGHREGYWLLSTLMSALLPVLSLMSCWDPQLLVPTAPTTYLAVGPPIYPHPVSVSMKASALPESRNPPDMGCDTESWGM